MDYCDIGSVRDMIELCNKPLKEDQIAYILQQSLQGLLYLHSMNIIHRDVKAGNILLDGLGAVKIADFGVSEQLSDAVSKSDTRIGTPLWMVRTSQHRVTSHVPRGRLSRRSPFVTTSGAGGDLGQEIRQPLRRVVSRNHGVRSPHHHHHHHAPNNLPPSPALI